MSYHNLKLFDFQVMKEEIVQAAQLLQRHYTQHSELISFLMGDLN